LPENYDSVKKYLFIGWFLLLYMQASTQPLLSEHAQISLVTCAPSDKAAYTLYGHTAVRVQDRIRLDSATWRDIDCVFNYGIFNFSEPNFIYRFTKGETDYMLAYYAYDEFIVDYQLRGSEVYEQTLNLSYPEKAAIWQALLLNAQPENRVYRYNFFFDNCSTRPAVLLEQHINGTILFEETAASPASFRQMINACTRNHPWLTFGCDLALGMPADRETTFREAFFLPENLKEAFAHARILRPDGSTQPLVSEEQILVEEIPDDDETAHTVFTPLLCSILFFTAILIITLFEWKKKRYFRALDSILYLCAGIAGGVLFFLCFVSVHPCTWPNLAVAWLHPFHLVGVILFAVKKLNEAAYYYHFINFAALLCMCFGWIFIVPYMNMAFIPLVLSFIIRAGYCFIRKLEHIG
jgi:hypothetical protein